MTDTDFERLGQKHISNCLQDKEYLEAYEEYMTAKTAYQKLDWNSKEGREAFDVMDAIAIKVISLQRNMV